MNDSEFRSNTARRVDDFLAQLSVQTDYLQVSFPSMNSKMRFLPFFFQYFLSKEVKNQFSKE